MKNENRYLNLEQYEINRKRVQEQRKLHYEIEELNQRRRVFHKDPKMRKDIERQISNKLKAIPRKSLLEKRLDALNLQPINSSLLLHLYPTNQNAVSMGVPMFSPFDPQQFVKRVEFGPNSGNWNPDSGTGNGGAITYPDPVQVAEWNHHVHPPVDGHRFQLISNIMLKGTFSFILNLNEPEPGHSLDAQLIAKYSLLDQDSGTDIVMNWMAENSNVKNQTTLFSKWIEGVSQYDLPWDYTDPPYRIFDEVMTIHGVTAPLKQNASGYMLQTQLLIVLDMGVPLPLPGTEESGVSWPTVGNTPVDHYAEFNFGGDSAPGANHVDCYTYMYPLPKPSPWGPGDIAES